MYKELVLLEGTNCIDNSKLSLPNRVLKVFQNDISRLNH